MSFESSMSKSIRSRGMEMKEVKISLKKEKKYKGIKLQKNRPNTWSRNSNNKEKRLNKKRKNSNRSFSMRSRSRNKTVKNSENKKC